MSFSELMSCRHYLLKVHCLGRTSTSTGPSTRASGREGEREGRHPPRATASSSSASLAPVSAGDAAAPAPPPQQQPRECSRSPRADRVDHLSRARFRETPGLFDYYCRLDPAAWTVDDVELKHDGIVHFRLSSRIAEGDAAASSRLLGTATLVEARVAIRVRPW